MDAENWSDKSVVWLSDTREFAFLIARFAYHSTVFIPEFGYAEIENDEYELWDERALDIESDN